MVIKTERSLFPFDYFEHLQRKKAFTKETR